MEDSIINQFKSELQSRLMEKTTFSKRELISLTGDVYSNVGIDINDKSTKTLYDIVIKFNREISKKFFHGRNQCLTLFDKCMLSVVNDGFVKINKNTKIQDALDRVKQRNNL